MRRMLCLATMCVAALAGRVDAAVFEFTIDPNQSSLSITPSVVVFGNPLPVTPQGAGAFSATYTGSLFADLTPTTIQLLAPSTLVAGISGNWRPGDDYSNYPADNNDPNGYRNTAAPANYGVFTDLTSLNGTTSISATRNLEISLNDLVPKALTAGAFAEAGTVTDFTSGTIFYGSGAAPPITDMVNTLFPNPTVDALGTATLSVSGPLKTLTIPVSFSVSYSISVLQLTTTYSGTIVATSIPEPASLGLLGCAVSGLMFCRRLV